MLRLASCPGGQKPSLPAQWQAHPYPVREQRTTQASIFSGLRPSLPISLKTPDLARCGGTYLEITGLRRQRRVDLCEFEDSLFYRDSQGYPSQMKKKIPDLSCIILHCLVSSYPKHNSLPSAALATSLCIFPPHQLFIFSD